MGRGGVVVGGGLGGGRQGEEAAASAACQVLKADLRHQTTDRSKDLVQTGASLSSHGLHFDRLLDPAWKYGRPSSCSGAAYRVCACTRMRSPSVLASHSLARTR